MEYKPTRTDTGYRCTECGGSIVEITVRDADGYDRWYECEKCGCACPECRRPMVFQGRDTSSGIEYREYRCPGCDREGVVRQGIALWKAYQAMNEAASSPSPRPALPGSIDRPVAWLVFDDVDGRFAAPLRPPGIVVGRDPEECDVALRSFAISRRHAHITVEANGTMWVEDLKSKGGTQVNQRPIVKASVALGDRLVLGQAEFEIRAEAPPDAQQVDPQRPSARGANRSGTGTAHSSPVEVLLSEACTPILAVVMRPPSAIVRGIALDVHLVNPTEVFFEVRAGAASWLKTDDHVERAGGSDPLVVAPRSAVRLGGVLGWEIDSARAYRLELRPRGHQGWERRTVDLSDSVCHGLIPIVGALGSIPRTIE